MKHYVVMCDCAVDSMGYDETPRYCSQTQSRRGANGT